MAEGPLPWKAVVVCCLGNSAHFYSICSVFTIAGFLCVDLGWTKSVDTAGFVAGWLGTALVVGRLFTAVAWGKAADRIGRRKCFLATCFFILIGNLAFGLSRSLTTALLTRFVFLGMLNGWVTLTGPIVNEIAGPSRQNDINAYVQGTGAAMQLVGPAAAAVAYGLIPRYPALGPAVVGAGLALAALLAGFFWLPETRGVVSKVEDKETNGPRKTRRDGYERLNEEPLYANTTFLLGVGIRVCTGLALFATFDVIPLWAISSRGVGGASMSKHHVAAVLGLAATGQFLINVTCMARILRRLGQRLGIRLSSATGALAISILPVVGGRLRHLPFHVQLPGLATIIILYYASSAMSFNAVSAVVNNSTDDNVRGKANGVATMFEALGKASGPTLGATAFAFFVQRRPGILGASLTFWGLAAILTTSALTTLFLPDSAENPQWHPSSSSSFKAAEGSSSCEDNNRDDQDENNSFVIVHASDNDDDD